MESCSSEETILKYKKKAFNFFFVTPIPRVIWIFFQNVNPSITARLILKNSYCSVRVPRLLSCYIYILYSLQLHHTQVIVLFVNATPGYTHLSNIYFIGKKPNVISVTPFLSPIPSPHRRERSRVACFFLRTLLGYPPGAGFPWRRVPPGGGRVNKCDRCPRGDRVTAIKVTGEGERYFAQGTTCFVGAAGLSHPTGRSTAAAWRRRRRCCLIRKECGPSAALPSRRPPTVRLRMWNVKCTTRARSALLPTRTRCPLLIDEYISHYSTLLYYYYYFDCSIPRLLHSNVIISRVVSDVMNIIINYLQQYYYLVLRVKEEGKLSFSRARWCFIKMFNVPNNIITSNPPPRSRETFR